MKEQEIFQKQTQIAQVNQTSGVSDEKSTEPSSSGEVSEPHDPQQRKEEYDPALSTHAFDKQPEDLTGDSTDKAQIIGD